jgi:hypothetical protein
MLFNSIEFAIFLPIVLTLFWWLPIRRNLKLQNLVVTAASYLFYGWWDYRFLLLILFSTLVDYFVGVALGRTESPRRRKQLLWTSIVVNLGFLGFFKYCNFFADSFANAFTFFGTQVSTPSLNIVLPIGISFYTLQTLSYTIDVYRCRLEPTRFFRRFRLLSVSFLSWWRVRLNVRRICCRSLNALVLSTTPRPPTVCDRFCGECLPRLWSRIIVRPAQTRFSTTPNPIPGRHWLWE